ncbi:MAG: hypothetical protein FJ077_09495 [Cyanobacteria bacterium K_DeepCast_35m_m2_023]|nr:hypothetical protein [Cyanobacteria bacterium K_DeepCast_35m_m2_023]
MDALAREISLIADLRRFEAIGNSRHYLHRSSLYLLGDIAITTAAFLPQMGETFDSPQCLVELPLSDRGQTTFRLAGKDYHCIPRQQGLFLPGQAMAATTHDASCMLGFNLDPTTLAVHLSSLAPRIFNARKARLFVQRPHCINLQDPRIDQVLRWLYRLFDQLAEQSPPNHNQCRPLIAGYEQLLYRATATLLCPDLIGINAQRQCRN